MNQTIFDIDQSLPKRQMVTYDLVPSQHLVNIRSVLASRKRKSNFSSVSPSALSPVTKSTLKTQDTGNKKQKQQVFEDMISGLPSPPVESPMAEFPSIMTPNNLDQSPPSTPSLTFTTSPDPSSTTQDSTTDRSCTEETEKQLTTEEIKSKLAKLREEKHNLFQLMKRLVEQEEQQRQQKQQVKKKKQSRWSTYQQPTPLPSPSLRYTPRPTNPTRPVQIQDGYFGSSQRPHRSHEPPFLY